MIAPTKPTNKATEAAQIEHHQHAHNALSTALWFVARGDIPAAMSRIRRAQSHLKIAIEGGAA
ncbi:hypothetical protein [Rhodoferax sp.]|uniref:hypothetical protein n=1 Tax=Rhodoferax sp. TaxID=50421 RepID=UPI002631B709|nr:hypothetical protein [Rhodoferax sp.]MDD3937675.1 hypothetical protein [Rhodoferax sp.]